MTDKIIVLNNCLIKLSDFRNVRFVERGKPVNPEKSLCWRKIWPGWLFNFKWWCESMPAVIGHYPWCIRTYRYMYVDEVMENLFSLYCSTWHAVRKCLWDFFRLSKWKPQKKLSRSYLQRKKMEKRRQKEFLTTWECLYCMQENFTTVAIVCHIRYESFAVLQNVFGISALSKWRRWKPFEETVYK